MVDAMFSACDAAIWHSAISNLIFDNVVGLHPELFQVIIESAPHSNALRMIHI